MKKIDFKAIYEGWRNDLIPPEEIKEKINIVHKYRMSICETCPKNSKNAKKDGYKTARLDVHCIECGCPLSKKTKALSKPCPLNKWEAVTEETEEFEIDKNIENNETKTKS